MEQTFQQMSQQMQQLIARQATLEGRLAQAQAQAQAAGANANPTPTQAHMEQVISLNAPVLNATMDADIVVVSKQLYWMMLMLLNGNAHTMLLNAGNGEGLAAWQSLHQHFKPRLKTRFAAQLMNLMACYFAGDSASGKKLDDEARIGIILLRLPDSPIRTHLLMLQAWADFRQEILSISLAMINHQFFPHGDRYGNWGACKGKGKRTPSQAEVKELHVRSVVGKGTAVTNVGRRTSSATSADKWDMPLQHVVRRLKGRSIRRSNTRKPVLQASRARGTEEASLFGFVGPLTALARIARRKCRVRKKSTVLRPSSANKRK
eukprot:1198107-Amphidinium_carterae.1